MKFLGTIKEIWRYPVSSVGGEALSAAEMSPAGLVGDRQFGLIDAVTGRPAAPEKDQRWRKALYLKASSSRDQLPSLVFPDGSSFSAGDPDLNVRLSHFFGFAAALAVHDDTGPLACFPRTPHRHRHHPLHLLTTASLAFLASLRHIDAIDGRRFRPTILVETENNAGFIESLWIGQRLHIGGTLLVPDEGTKRCGLTFIPQPGIAEDPEILRQIVRHNRRHFGIYCSVERQGSIALGDQVFLDTHTAGTKQLSVPLL